MKRDWNIFNADHWIIQINLAQCGMHTAWNIIILNVAIWIVILLTNLHILYLNLSELSCVYPIWNGGHGARNSTPKDSQIGKLLVYQKFAILYYWIENGVGLHVLQFEGMEPTGFHQRAFEAAQTSGMVAAARSLCCSKPVPVRRSMPTLNLA